MGVRHEPWALTTLLLNEPEVDRMPPAECDDFFYGVKALRRQRVARVIAGVLSLAFVSWELAMVVVILLGGRSNLWFFDMHALLLLLTAPIAVSCLRSAYKTHVQLREAEHAEAVGHDCDDRGSSP